MGISDRCRGAASTCLRVIGAVLLLLLGIAVTAPRAGATGPSCQDSWVNPAGGTWSSTGASYWSTGAPPTSAQYACITIPLTAPVVLNVSGTAAGLTLGSSTGTAELQMNNTSLTLGASSSVATNGEIVGYGIITLSSGATLTNDGTINVTGSLQLLGSVTNNPDGLVEVTNGAPLFVDTGTFTNSGELFLQPNTDLQAPAGGHTGAVIDNAGGLIENQGTINVQTGGIFDQGSGDVIGDPVTMAWPYQGALDLTGDGTGTFVLAGNSTISGDVAAGQTVVIDGGITASGSFTNAGTVIGGSGTLTLTIANGGVLTNTGSIVVPPGNALIVAGNVDNAATGTIALSGSGFQLSGAVTLTNDGTITVPPNSALSTGVAGNPGTIDNDFGSIDNGGTITANQGGTFVQGDGNTTGNFVIIDGALDITGNGAASFDFLNSNSTISGDIASAQIVHDQSVITAGTSFTNNGTFIGDGGTLVLPTGGTLTNNGTIEEGHGGGGSAGFVIDGNLTSTATGVIGENYGGLKMGTAGTTFDNAGTMYLLYPSGFLLGNSNCGGSGQPSCDITWNNTGTIYWGMGSATWGGFGGVSSFGGSTGDVVNLGGTIIPVPEGEPTMPTTPPPNPTITYDINGLGTGNPPTYTLSCPAAVTSHWSIGCAGTATLYEYDYGTNTTLVPTMVSLTSTGAVNQFGWVSAYGQPVTMTATVSAQDASTPTGTVAFYAAAELNQANSNEQRPDLLATAALSTAGGVTTAALTTSLPPGVYNLLALYMGDSTHLAASTQYGDQPTSQPESGGAQTVLQQTTTLTLGSSGSPTGFASPVTFTATVSPGLRGPSDPRGFVTFDRNGNPFGTAPVTTSNGVTTAQLTTSDLPPGSDPITAVYSGDYNYSGSSTPTVLTQTVNVTQAQRISFTAPGSGVVGGSAPLSPTSSSGLAVTLAVDASSSPSGACSLSGPVSGVYTVNYLHSGSCVLDGTQAGDTTYAPALGVDQTITIGPAAQTIAFTAPPGGQVGGSAPLAPTSSSGLAVTLTVDPSSTAGACSLLGPVSGVYTVNYLLAGSCVIDANQAGNSDYQVASQVSQSIAVSQVAQTITFTAPGSGVVGASAPLSPTATSGFAVTLTVDSSTTPADACVLGGAQGGYTVYYAHSGVCVLDASQAGDTTYAPAPQVPQTITIGPASQTITFTAPLTGQVGGSALLSPAASSGLAVTLTVDPSSTPGTCSLSGPASNVYTVSYLLEGSCVLDANQAGNSDYQGAYQVQQTIAISRVAQTITFTAPGSGVVGTSAPLSPTSSSGFSVTLMVDPSSSPSDACSLSGPTAGVYTVSYLHSGACVLDASQAGDTTYAPASQVTQTITIGPASQTITFTAPLTGQVGGSALLSPAASSGLAVTLTVDPSSTPGACSLSGPASNVYTVSYLLEGSCVIDANQAGDSDYQVAAQVSQSVSVSQVPQTISFTAPGSGVVGASAPLSPTSSSGYSVTLTVDPSTTPFDACSLGGAPGAYTVYYEHSGSCVIDANQSGDTTYAPAPQASQTITIGLAAQTISFTAPVTGQVGGSESLSPTSSSGLAVTLTVDPSSTPGACSLSGPTLGVYTVSYLLAGSCVVDANQAGNSDYQVASQVSQAIAVSQVPQSISFTAPVSGLVGGSAPLSPTSSSGLAVTLTVDPSTTPADACVLGGAPGGYTVYYAHSGVCVLDANQAGDTTYALASQVPQSIPIGPASQTITFTSTAPASTTVGAADYTPAAFATSGLPVAISLDPSSSGCALSSTGVVSFPAAGTCLIDANQAGNADYLPATQVQQAITVTASALTPEALEALTIADVESSAKYMALSAKRQQAVTTEVGALLNPLDRISTATPQEVKANLIDLYKFKVMLLSAEGWIGSGQAATLMADANLL